MQVITGAVVAGLSSISSLVADTKGHSIELVTNTVAVKKIILAAVVEIMCTKQPEGLSRSKCFAVTGLVRAYTVTVDSAQFRKSHASFGRCKGLLPPSVSKAQERHCRLLRKLLFPYEALR
jgi:hypothetical protein